MLEIRHPMFRDVYAKWASALRLKNPASSSARILARYFVSGRVALIRSLCFSRTSGFFFLLSSLVRHLVHRRTTSPFLPMNSDGSFHWGQLVHLTYPSGVPGGGSVACWRSRSLAARLATISGLMFRSLSLSRHVWHVFVGPLLPT